MEPLVRRVSHPYTVWEDWKAGMYATPANMAAEVEAARELLANPPGLGEAMRDACAAWPIAAEHNLTNEEQNRRSWLGHAACHYTTGAVRLATCAAWGMLTDDQRDDANAVADTVLADWVATREGASVLFAFNPISLIPRQRVHRG